MSGETVHSIDFGSYRGAGMVHHKIHDEKWTALPTVPAGRSAAAVLLPALDRGDLERRGRRRPLCARVRPLGHQLAARCLAAAEEAWRAAGAHPATYAQNCSPPPARRRTSACPVSSPAQGKREARAMQAPAQARVNSIAIPANLDVTSLSTLSKPTEEPMSL